MTNKIPYTPPEFRKSAFNCPFCEAYSNQIWHAVYYHEMGYIAHKDLYICFCKHCDNASIWFAGRMIYPDFVGVEQANRDLSKGIKDDYKEAVLIVRNSPRGAAALLRLAIQKLCIQLGEKGDNLNTDIANLVKKGLPTKVQESLDSLRVIGNEAVHPGELNLKDDFKTAYSLFKLVNFIAEKMLTEPKEIDEIYNKISDAKKKQIIKRDK